MADNLTDDQRRALAAWASFGAPGSQPEGRWEPTDEERERLLAFTTPGSGPWPMEFDAHQTRSLLWGHHAGAMEDKWNVYSEVSGSTASVHFHRSWTGLQVVQLELELTETGSRVIRATWELDASDIKEPSEDFALGQFVAVFRHVLGNQKPPRTPQ
ncbi:MAG: hypothetical protein ACOH1T_00330 [Microbacteriaceae bacterium]